MSGLLAQAALRWTSYDLQYKARAYAFFCSTATGQEKHPADLSIDDLLLACHTPRLSDTKQADHPLRWFAHKCTALAQSAVRCDRLTTFIFFHEQLHYNDASLLFA